MARARESNDTDVGVAGTARGALPGRDARVDRLPLVVLSVEQQYRYAHTREELLRDEVHVRPYPVAQLAPHVRLLDARLAGLRVDCGLRSVLLSPLEAASSASSCFAKIALI